MSDWETIAKHIAASTGRAFQADRRHKAGGGCINEAFVLEDKSSSCRYFVKVNRPEQLEMFEAEAAGLAELARPGVIGVPAPLCWGKTGSQAYLAMEYVDSGSASPAMASLFGRQLAAMHRSKGQSRFGWYRNNTIGATLQVNSYEDNWIEFWRVHRLGFQLDLAARNGYGGTLQREGKRLLADLDRFFSGYTPIPSLLHGDLWSGNYTVDSQGRPVIFDPAVYYGDREADLAMTELFGGFPVDFYRAYEAAWPLDSGYKQRKTLYNLYHILNHLNLFGSGYLGQAERMINSMVNG